MGSGRWRATDVGLDQSDEAEGLVGPFELFVGDLDLVQVFEEVH